MKTTRKKVSALAASLIIFGSLAGGANAAITFSSDGNSLTLTITEDIVFTPPQDTGGSQIFFVIEDAFSSSPSSNFVVNMTSGTATVMDSLGNFHGTGITGTMPNIGYGNFTVGELDPNDFVFGFVDFSDPLLIAEDSNVTLTAGTFTLIGTSVPELPDFVNSTITLVDNNLESVAPSQAITTVIPEPSSAFLMGIGALGLVIRRRRIN